MEQNGVIEKSTGDLLRCGFCDFENDGSLDSETEEVRTDVPFPAYCRGQRESGVTFYYRWNGESWVEVTFY